MTYLTPGLAKSRLLRAGAAAFLSLDGRSLHVNYQGFCMEFVFNNKGEILATDVVEFLTRCIDEGQRLTDPVRGSRVTV